MPRLTILRRGHVRRPVGFWHTATPLWLGGTLLLAVAVVLLLRH